MSGPLAVPAPLLTGSARVLAAGAAVAGWQFGAQAARSPYFPPPSVIVPDMYRKWFSGPPDHLWLTSDAIANLLPSLGRMLGGWAVAAAAGIAIGVVIGRVPGIADLTEPLVHFGRAVPPPTLVPVFLFVFRIGTPMEVATIVFGVIWPVLLNSIDGTRHTDPVHLETARAFRLSAAQRMTRVILPGAAPKIFAGLRLSLALALIMMVISEFAGSTNGIGNEMLTAQSVFNIPLMWSVILLLGLLGITLNTALGLTERRVLAWQHRLCETTYARQPRTRPERWRSRCRLKSGSLIPTCAPGPSPVPRECSTCSPGCGIPGRG